jgi:hypothetical protein
MGCAALANVMHVAGHPLPSHCSPPIVVVQLQSSDCHPLTTAVVFIDIVAIGGGSGIITIAIAVAVALAVAITISTIAVVAVIVNVALSMLLHKHCPCCAPPWRPIRGAGPNHATEALPMACGWRLYPWIGHAGAGSIDKSS